MKKFLFILMIAVTGGAMKCAAQDVIVKKDGSTIVSKVLEITSTEVKYKKFTNLQGPTYTVAKTELQAINYENGEKDTFVTENKINKNTSGLGNENNIYTDIPKVSDKELLAYSNNGIDLNLKAKRLKKAGIIGCIPIYGFFMVSGIICFAGEQVNAAAVMWASGAAAGTLWLVPFLVRSHKVKTEALYSIHTTPLFEHQFQLKNKGMSLTTGVNILNDHQIKTSPTLGIGLRLNL